MSQESHAPKSNAGAPKRPLLKNEAETVIPDSPITNILEPVPSETIAELVQIESKAARSDRPLAAATKSPGQETVVTQTPGQERVAASDKVGTVLGDYKLLRKLGQGGMGEVYEAYQISRDRIVALKLLASQRSGNSAFIERFKREARTMVKVDHPNILRCLDVGHADGCDFLITEYIAGGSVEDWLRKLGRFSLGDALHIILKVAHALQHAHDRNIIHRDVKPANVLMANDGAIKLADLGLAKDIETDISLTKTGIGAGTPIYMAPEQARDAKRVDGRVDIYALGVMLYVFLTGLPPFKGKTFVELIHAKDKGKFDPIRKHNDAVPPKLDLIVDKMLAMDPGSRFAVCEPVIAELEALGHANETLSFLKAKLPERPAPVKKIAQASTMMQMPAPARVTQPAEEETFEKDVWYLNLVKGPGKIVTMKTTTEQVRLLIKTGNLNGEAQISKSEKTGFRDVATFPEFQTLFKSREPKTEVSEHRREFGNHMKELVELDAPRRSSVLPTFMQGFGLLWILLILAGVVAGGYFVYITVFV